MSERPPKRANKGARDGGSRSKAAGPRKGGKRRNEEPLRLLPARTVPMTPEQEAQLVESLAELLVELVEAGKLQRSELRSARGCDLDGSTAKADQR